MQCYHPIVLRRERGGDYSASGYNSRVVPCGRCLACRCNKSREWSFRLQCEALMSESVWFVTLTYEDEYLPCVEDTGEVTLVKSDLSGFIKRLRNYLPKLRYFGCGEYGDKFGRPHYHVLLFFRQRVDKDVVESACQRAWHYNDSVTNPIYVAGYSASVAKYVSKYVVKQLGYYRNEDIQSPFALMSLRPGIGAGVMAPEFVRRVRESGQHVVSDLAGYKYAVPRYYKDLLYSRDEWVMYNERMALERPYLLPESMDDVLAGELKEHDALRERGVYAEHPAVLASKRAYYDYYDASAGIEPNDDF